jgi:hypothetical protein
MKIRCGIDVSQTVHGDDNYEMIPKGLQSTQGRCQEFAGDGQEKGCGEI